MNHSAIALTIFLGIAQASGTVSGANVIDLNRSGQSSQKGAVLFPFDSYSVPSRHGLQLELIQAKRYEGNPVLEPGGPGKVDTNAMTYYGDVITGISEPIRIRVNWDGLRLEDARVYAVYVEMAE